MRNSGGLKMLNFVVKRRLPKRLPSIFLHFMRKRLPKRLPTFAKKSKNNDFSTMTDTCQNVCQHLPISFTTIKKTFAKHIYLYKRYIGKRYCLMCIKYAFGIGKIGQFLFTEKNMFFSYGEALYTGSEVQHDY